MMLILGVLKNRVTGIPKVWNSIVETINKFPKSKVIFYENNSTDGTKELLKSYQNKFSWFTLISEDLSIEYLDSHIKSRTWDNKYCRMECISLARNTLLDYIKDELEHFEYVLWIDPDDGNWDPISIEINLRRDKNTWDAIFCNDVQSWKKKYTHNVYYDMYALRNNFQPFGLEIDDIKYKKYIIDTRNSELIPVFSAFSGMGLFKSYIFKQLRFSTFPDEIIASEYVKISKYVNKPFPNNNITKHSETINGVRFISNSGFEKVIICEHVGLCFHMRNKGYDKLFIDPQWLYFRHGNNLKNKKFTRSQLAQEHTNASNSNTFLVIFLSILSPIILLIVLYFIRKKVTLHNKINNI